MKTEMTDIFREFGGGTMGRVINGLAALFLALVPMPLQADDSKADTQAGFVEANILSVFYHELGHAIIATEQLPVFGQEEDAADIFSALMITYFFDDETAVQLGGEAALGFWREAQARRQQTDEIAWWGVHGIDEQRFYTTVCILYGADPDNRQDFAHSLGLPEERAETCPEEFEQADSSWGEVIDTMIANSDGPEMVFSDDDNTFAGEIIGEEIAYLNSEMRLSETVTVSIEACGEPNAFFDPADNTIVFCTEFEDYLFELATLPGPDR